MTASPLPHAGTTMPVVALLVDPHADPQDVRGVSEAVLLHHRGGGRRPRGARESHLRPSGHHVTETQLPGINGFDLCSLLRQDAATRAIPIVVVTSDAFEVDPTRVWQVGADAVLIKPCLPQVLFAEIQRLLTRSASLRERADAVRKRMRDQSAKSERLIELSRAVVRRQMLSSVHIRQETTTPPVIPPALVCPACDQPLGYLRSHVGGVSARHPEQWDYFECAGGCGQFQYRERTRKLRRA